MPDSISPDHNSKSAYQILGLILGMIVMYLCSLALRFANDILNLGFFCIFLLLPLLAIRPALHFRHWAKVAAIVFLVPLAAGSLVGLFFTIIFDIPAAINHTELSRELGTIQQGRYSVHLVREETAGGALGPHGAALEQRMALVPGLYVVKYLDYFPDAREGNLTVVSPGEIAVHIPGTEGNRKQDRVYTLKPLVYF